MNSTRHPVVLERARMRCEAWFPAKKTRCNHVGSHVHHRITRARGGKMLDEVGEVRHLTLLCNRCHLQAHNGMDLLAWFDRYPLILRGQVMTRPDGSVYVWGTDHPNLAAEYPQDVEDAVDTSKEVTGSDSDKFATMMCADRNHEHSWSQCLICNP